MRNKDQVPAAACCEQALSTSRSSFIRMTKRATTCPFTQLLHLRLPSIHSFPLFPFLPLFSRFHFLLFSAPLFSLSIIFLSSFQPSVVFFTSSLWAGVALNWTPAQTKPLVTLVSEVFLDPVFIGKDMTYFCLQTNKNSVIGWCQHWLLIGYWLSNNNHLMTLSMLFIGKIWCHCIFIKDNTFFDILVFVHNLIVEFKVEDKGLSHHQHSSKVWQSCVGIGKTCKVQKKGGLISDAVKLGSYNEAKGGAEPTH